MGAEVKREDDGDAVPLRKSTISRKNQITLPVAAMAAAHLESGDVVQVKVEGDGVIKLMRYRDPRLDLLEELAGSVPGLTELTNLEELRNEWER